MFILKRYPNKDSESDYQAEVNGFRSIKSAESVIKFYGSYIYGDEFNILLEYADKGSLDVYFQTETPPSRGSDIIKFWASMFKLIEGLKVIHNVRGLVFNYHLIYLCTNTILRGHHDVKPTSIVILSNGSKHPSDWSFKFADFGQNVGPRDTELMLNEMQNAPTYGTKIST